MPAYSLTREQAIAEVEEVEAALRQGAPPPGLLTQGAHVVSAIRAVAIKLRRDPNTVRRRVGTPSEQGSTEKKFGRAVDWSLYAPPSEPEPPALAAEPLTEQTTPADPVELRRLRDKNEALTSANKDLERRIIASENWRADVLGLRDMAPSPVGFGPRSDNDPHAETIVLFLSDLQWGEKVWLEAMDGLNSYDLPIARRRLGRWTYAVCDLATKHWSGPPPDRIILILGGDLISGALHYELAKTDELKPLAAVRDVADHLRSAILMIRDAVSCPIDIISLPGNHGRTTLKPESKEVTATSLDMLVSDFLEIGLKDIAGISFFAPTSPDALFSVYGWRVLAHHGDKTGSRGGQGFVGPAATAARGFKKIIGDYAARGVHLDLILTGHLHTPLQLEEGFVNGCLPGPTEYSRDARFRPKPAQQLFFTTHPRRLLAQIRWIEVGDPSEGSLYEPPPIDRPLRPRYRVKATSEAA